MPLDSTRVTSQSEDDALWAEAIDNGEADWQWQGIEKRRFIPQRLGRGESRVIELQPGLTIYIDTAWYWRPLCLDYE